MPVWQVTVVETVNNEVRYTIEADSLEEAQEKADAGDTVDEQYQKTYGVIARYWDDEFELVEGDKDDEEVSD